MRAPRPRPTLRERALRLLAKREYSQRELAQRLQQGGGGAAEIEALLVDFAQRGWLSDQRFAESRIRFRAGTVSRRYIAQELEHYGIADEMAQIALGGLEQDDYQTALSLWQRKFGKSAQDDKERARQVRFLLARGFALDLVLRLLRAQGSGLAPEEGE